LAKPSEKNVAEVLKREFSSLEQRSSTGVHGAP